MEYLLSISEFEQVTVRDSCQYFCSKLYHSVRLFVDILALIWLWMQRWQVWAACTNITLYSNLNTNTEVATLWVSDTTGQRADRGLCIALVNRITKPGTKYPQGGSVKWTDKDAGCCWSQVHRIAKETGVQQRVFWGAWQTQTTLCFPWISL